MPRFFVSLDNIIDNKIKIEGKDINHIKNVLRLNINDKIDVCNNIEHITYICKIIKIEKEYVECEIIEKKKEKEEENINIKVTIFQGLPKADKMELIIQKSVELGVHNIYPVECKRTVVKLNEKDKIKKIQRWQNISEVAAKQARRNLIPMIEEIIKINNICNIVEEYDIILVAYEKEEKNTLKEELKKFKKEKLTLDKEYKIGIVIGPEGGFEENEIQMLKKYNGNIKVITLGTRILRTETVALNVLSNIIYELEI